MSEDRIRKAFETAQTEGRIALVPYVTVGFPEVGLTTDIVRAVSEAGADVIQASGHTALMNGVTPQDCIVAAKEIRAAGI